MPVSSIPHECLWGFVSIILIQQLTQMCVCWGEVNWMGWIILLWVVLGSHTDQQLPWGSGFGVIGGKEMNEEPLSWLNPDPLALRWPHSQSRRQRPHCFCGLDLNKRTRTLWHTKVLRLDRTWPQMKWLGGNAVNSKICVCVQKYTKPPDLWQEVKG